MTLSRRSLAKTTLAAPFFPLRQARAQSMPIRLGILTDLSGIYKDNSGKTSVACAQQAVAEFASSNELQAEVIAADHQNKADIGAGIVRQWFDRESVDVLMDVPNSAVALAVSAICRDKDKVFIASQAATTALTGSQCTPNTLQWTYDTFMLARSNGGATVKAGKDTWFIIAADLAFGKVLNDEVRAVVQAAGGKVLETAYYPFPGTTDVSSLLLQAQASGAKVLAFANAAAETVNCVKQAQEFGLANSMKLAALLMYVTDVHALGLEAAQGLTLTETFYWDLNDRTRASAERVRPRTPTNMPNMGQAGCYSGAMHYLKAAASLGAADTKRSGKAVVDRMNSMPTDDDAFGPGIVRQDGRVLHPAYLFRVKTPAESKGPWDLLSVVATTPGEQAFRPLFEGNCPLVRL